MGMLHNAKTLQRVIEEGATALDLNLVNQYSVSQQLPLHLGTMEGHGPHRV